MPCDSGTIALLDRRDLVLDVSEAVGRFTPHKHATLADYQNRLPPGQFAELFKFCAVRDPWSRAISFYFTPRRWMKRGLSPYWSRDEFVELLPQIAPMVDQLKIDGQIQDMDGIVRHENLAEQLSAVLGRIGIEVDEDRIPHLNRSLAGSYRTYFEADQDLVDLVAERYREDIAYFGYRFEGEPPRERSLRRTSLNPRRRSVPPSAP